MTLPSKLVETNQRRVPVELDLSGRQQRVPAQESNQEWWAETRERHCHRDQRELCRGCWYRRQGLPGREGGQGLGTRHQVACAASGGQDLE